MVKDPATLKLVVASSVASDRVVFAESMTEDMVTDARGDLPSIKTPTLVLYEHDTTLQQPNADTYEQTVQASYKGMANVRLVQMDDSRHFTMS